VLFSAFLYDLKLRATTVLQYQVFIKTIMAETVVPSVSLY